jgi:hypothetical protein
MMQNVSWLQAEECLKREKERVGHYLHASSEQKLLEVSNLAVLEWMYKSVWPFMEASSLCHKPRCWLIQWQAKMKSSLPFQLNKDTVDLVMPLDC